MKSSCKSARSILSASLLAALAAAPLFLLAPNASARGIEITRRSPYAGYGYGYGWGYPVTTAPVNPPTVNPPRGNFLPAGCITQLPADAAPVVVFGKTYYFSDGNYYQQIVFNGQTVYQPANP